MFDIRVCRNVLACVFEKEKEQRKGKKKENDREKTELEVVRKLCV